MNRASFFWCIDVLYVYIYIYIVYIYIYIYIYIAWPHKTGNNKGSIFFIGTNFLRSQTSTPTAQAWNILSDGCKITKMTEEFYWKARQNIWVFPKIGIPQNGWFIMENPIIWFGGYPYFWKHPYTTWYEEGKHTWNDCLKDKWELG